MEMFKKLLRGTKVEAMEVLMKGESAKGFDRAVEYAYMHYESYLTGNTVVFRDGANREARVDLDTVTAILGVEPALDRR